MRRAARKDENHNPIAEHLESLGWSVLDMSRLGGGAPDMLAARRGFSALIEAKRDGKAKLKPGQQTFAAKWKGVCIKAISPEDAEEQLDLAEKYQYLRCAGYKA